MGTITLVIVDDAMALAKVTHMVWPLHVKTSVHDRVDVALIIIFDLIKQVVIIFRDFT